MQDPISVFRQEADEHLGLIESALLELEGDPRNEAVIAALFRSVHTIKGSAGMVGLEGLSRFAHHLESLLDDARQGALVLTSEQISLLLAARDHLADLLAEPSPSTSREQVGERIVAALVAARTPTAEVAGEGPLADSPEEGPAEGWRLMLRPDADAFRAGFDPLPVLRELHALGGCEVTVELVELPPGETFDPERCYLAFTLSLQTEASREEVESVFLFVAEDWCIEIEAVERASAPPEDRLVTAEAEVDDRNPSVGVPAHSSADVQTVRVAQSKLDMLMEQVGELVILQARLEQLALDRGDEQLAGLAEEMERLSSGLRETAFDVRMLPIGSMFGRFRRLVRDLANELGKEVNLTTEGEDTELDKVVIDRLADPLVHLIRNSLDHGIEIPAARREHGKEGRGSLRLAAGQHQGQIRITLADDGAGLDRRAILAKAIDRGVVDAEASLTDREIDQLIFEPGFSTAAEVSDVSGRGVGMDVVKRSIESLRGRVSLDSTPGEGTRVEITLPMTLAIIDGLMVGVGDERYVLPLNTVEECIETAADDVSVENGVRLIRHRDALVPCLRLREGLGVDSSGARPRIEQTVVVRVGEERVGVTVDQVIGNFQTVIKSLGSLYQEVRGVMGATIMGDGQIAMILDVGGLIDQSKF